MAIYRVAELLVSMQAHGMTLQRAKPYLDEESADKKPDITITVDAATMQQRAFDPNFSADYREYLETGAQFYTALAQHQGMLLHSSCVVVDGRAYLFSAPCGTGKSTHTSLWLKQFGERAYILNDDKPALRIIDGQVYVYGTPWSGKHALNRNERVKLQSICFLYRAKENRITRMPVPMAVVSLLDQTTRRLDTRSMEHILDVVQQLVQSCKVCSLGCNMELSAAQTAYDFMSRDD